MFRYLVAFAALFAGLFATNAQDKRIFVWGGDIDLKFTRYVAELTGKEKPRICYVPTASGDHPDHIDYWNRICHALNIDTLVLRVWVSASPENSSFEEQLLGSDAIVVGGGNTLNMMGIWKAQGIDKVLAKALDRGIVLSGGSAGSICWFEGGISDSRPVDWGFVEGLGFLPYSNCPHYSQEVRRDLYDSLIGQRKIGPGYAFDERAGILFVNGRVAKVVTQSDRHHVYYVGRHRGAVTVEKLDADFLVARGALPEGAYEVVDVNKKVRELEAEGETSPLSAYVTTLRNVYGKNLSYLDSKVNKIFLFNDEIAGVVNDQYLDSMGVYSVWYFYNRNGVWENAGEDFGGGTVLESEIAFREKAERILRSQRGREDYFPGWCRAGRKWSFGG